MQCDESYQIQGRTPLALQLMQLSRYRGGDVVGLSPNIRIYRYSAGQFFDAHCMSHPHVGQPASQSATFGGLTNLLPLRGSLSVLDALRATSCHVSQETCYDPDF